jgi:hypothetical protein
VNNTRLCTFAPAALSPDPDLLPDPALIALLLSTETANTATSARPYSLVSLHDIPGLLFSAPDTLIEFALHATPSKEQKSKNKRQQKKGKKQRKNVGK